MNLQRDEAIKALEVLELLKRELPFCFVKGSSKKPLKLGIDRDVLRYYQQETRFSQNELRLAIQLYTRNPKYYQSIVVGATRVDIQGNPAGIVTSEEACYAKSLVTRAKPITVRHVEATVAEY